MVTTILRFLHRQVLLNPLILAVVMVLSGALGILLLLDTPLYLRRMAEVRQLPSLRAGQLADATLGQPALLEGTISADNPTIDGAFVAFVREEYSSDPLDLTGSTNSPQWIEVARSTPPLAISLSDGDAWLSNADYRFDTTAFTRQDAAATVTRGAIQSRGYRVGDPVLAIGTVVEGTTGRQLQAEMLYAGDRTHYLTELEQAARRSWPLGAGLLLLAFVSGFFCIREFLRFLREIRAEQDTQPIIPPRTSRKRPR